MAISLFGYTLKKTKKEEQRRKADSFVAPSNDDGATTVEGVGSYGAFIDLDGSTRNEYELITRYREMSLLPEVDNAIDDVVNEAIVQNGGNNAIELDLSDLEKPDSLKTKIYEAFDEILVLLNWDNNAYDLFKRWYIDGRLYYHTIPNEKNKKEGLLEIRYIDPRQIRRIREIERDRDQSSGVELIRVIDEYYTYNPRGLAFNGNTYSSSFSPGNSVEGVKIALDSVTYVHSGIFDKFSATILSNLHKAIKPINQLKMMEDALVIYRIARAPERRIFYVDVGNLPKSKADDYLRSIMQRYRNKLQYNIETGEVKEGHRFLSMLEDYWLPRREGSQGTSIDTLPGGENLGEMSDVDYFNKKVYKALNVPVSRLDPEGGFNLGRATEISRDEVKFTKFIHRLRMRFSHLFDDLLGKQLILKGILNMDDWNEIKEHTKYKWANDNHFSELKDAEIMRNRLELMALIDPYSQKYYSVKWIRKNVLKQSEDEQRRVDEDIKQEKDKYPKPAEVPDSLKITNFDDNNDF